MKKKKTMWTLYLSKNPKEGLPNLAETIPLIKETSPGKMNL
jgi:hypothetical protein